jgi:nicotinamidase-related amidase
MEDEVTSRVWDRFLTPQDRAHVASRATHRSGLGSTPALILVDLYRSVFGDRPEPLLEAIKEWPASCGVAGWEALPHIQSVLRAARAAGVAVVHVTSREDLPHWRSGTEDAPQARGTSEQSSEAAARTDRFEILPEVAPQGAEPVLRKAAPSAFWGTPLVAYLNQLRVDTLLVVGESTSGCVRATVVDAASYRFRVAVVEECVFDRHEAAHAMNLFDMDQKYADVIGTHAALSYLGTFALPRVPVEVA